jgi:hypothetical protein
LATTFANFIIQYPGCVRIFLGLSVPGPDCTPDQQTTFSDFYTGILEYHCNGDPTSEVLSSEIPSSEVPFTQTSPPSAAPPTESPSTQTPPSSVCPMFEVITNGTCQCLTGFIRDSNTGRCVCPSGYHIVNGTCVSVATESGNCVCTENEFYDYVQKKCRCLTGFYRDPNTGKCLIECIYCGEFEVYNSTLEMCVCSPGYVRLIPLANCTLG